MIHVNADDLYNFRWLSILVDNSSDIKEYPQPSRHLSSLTSTTGVSEPKAHPGSISPRARAKALPRTCRMRFCICNHLLLHTSSGCRLYPLRLPTNESRSSTVSNVFSKTWCMIRLLVLGTSLYLEREEKYTDVISINRINSNHSTNRPRVSQLESASQSQPGTRQRQKRATSVDIRARKRGRRQDVEYGPQRAKAGQREL